ncbi:MAG: hypothetical protein KTR25_21135 [Myxococcales bacterium]|nr:hypothetical protein [Myxococcales bacterium]
MLLQPGWRSSSVGDELIVPKPISSENVVCSRPVLVVDADASPWVAALSAAGFWVIRVSEEEALATFHRDSTPVLGIMRIGLFVKFTAEGVLPPDRRWLLVTDAWEPAANVVDDTHGVIHLPFEPHVLVNRVRSFLAKIGSELPPHAHQVPWPEGETMVARNGVLRGKLNGRLDFASLLGSLIRRRYTGALLLRRDSIKKVVYLRDGQPTFVRSNLLGECLGQQMVASRLISESVCARALENKRGDGPPLGQVLMDMGEISELNLRVALQSQLEHKMLDMFSWQTGEYRTIQGHHGAAAVALEPSTALLMYQGLYHISDTAGLIAMLYPIRKCHLLVASQASHDLANLMHPEAWRALLSSRSTEVGTLLAEKNVDRASRVRLIVALGLVGHLRLFAPKEPCPPQASDQVWGRGLRWRTELQTEASSTSNPQDILRVSVWPANVTKNEEVKPPRGLVFCSHSSGEHNVVQGDELVPSPFMDEEFSSTDDSFQEDLRLDWMSALLSSSPEGGEGFESNFEDIENTKELDVEPIAFERLRERYGSVLDESPWGRLDLIPGNYEVQEIHRAYVAVRVRLESDVSADSRLSGRCAHLAESALVVLDDARADLMHPDASRRQRSEEQPTRPTWLLALEAFEAGLYALSAGDEATAETYFAEASMMEPKVPEYQYYRLACRATSRKCFEQRLGEVSNGLVGERYFAEGPEGAVPELPSRERGRTIVPRAWSGWLNQG